MAVPFNEAAAAAGERAVAFNTSDRGWDIDSNDHALGMLLCDLIEYADREGIDLDAQLSLARETVADCRT